jgi:hypothetical protein
MTYLSEIFPLNITEPNLMGFRLTPDIDRKVGNSLSWHFTRKFPNLVVVWYQQSFWVLGKVNCPMPTSEEWKATLGNIQEEKQEFKHFYWSFQWLHQPQANSEILARLADTVLSKHRPFSSEIPWESKGIEVRLIIKFWSETIELERVLKPAVALTTKGEIVYKGSLTEFFENHPYRHDPASLLVGLQVKEIEKSNNATIVDLPGTVGEHRESLINNATGSISKRAIQEAPDDQPLVSVKFGTNSLHYSYAMAALRPMITSETASKFDVDYGQFLKQTKVPYKKRQKLLTKAREDAEPVLSLYGFEMSQKCVNSKQHQSLFWTPEVSLEKTSLLFGKGFKFEQGKILTGLSKGGVYKRHENYRQEPIRIAAIKLCDKKLGVFLQEVQTKLTGYDFNNEVIDTKSIKLTDGNAAEQRVLVEQTMNELLSVPVDVVLVFLPQGDRYSDNTDAGSYYDKLYSLLLNRRIASQFIYENTLESTDSKNIINQIVPGILAKLGNIPFVLAEPLSIADYILGLDISRLRKKNAQGTLNACASIRLYGSRGEFINYRLEGELIEGETIPLRFLEKILPESVFANRTVLIYRDGRFVGGEIENLVTRAKAINAKFILVECKKSQTPRLYGLEDKTMAAPTQGLALKLSPSEAILVTTKMPEKIGVPRPLRLNIRQEGEQVSIEKVVETSLKLTLLHHGALKIPRLPMPLHGADRMAQLRLKGIYPNILEGDRQFWL